MKILLISPPFTAILPPDYGRPALYEPLGLGYLGAVARDAGHEVRILDCVAEGWQSRQRLGEWTRVGLSDEAIADRLRAFEPDLIGVTNPFTSFARDALHVVDLAMRTWPEAPILMGGADASARAQELIQHPGVDLIVRGEGERTFLNVLTHYERGSRLPQEALGTTTKRRHNPPQEEIEDVDTLPLPARDLLPMDIYLEDQRSFMPFAKRRPVASVISSRGCPCDSIRCSVGQEWPTWRPRAPEKVVDEIDALVREYGVREIAFQDDRFLEDPDRVREICEEMIRRRLRVTWGVPQGLAVDRLSEPVLRVMKRAGFYHAHFAVESGDPAMLRWLHASIDLSQVREAIAACQRLGLWTSGSLTIGFPEQSMESIEQTANFAVHSGLDMISVCVAQPYAGSALYQVYEDLGLLERPDAEGSTIFNSRYDTKHPAAELSAKRDAIHRRFAEERVRRLRTPKGLLQLLRKICTPGRLAYAVRVLKKLATTSLHRGRWNHLGTSVRSADRARAPRMPRA